MKNKKVVGIVVLVVLLAVVIGLLVWQNQNTPEKGENYLTLFGDNIGSDKELAYEYRKHTFINITKITKENGDTGVAKIYITVPDIVKLYDEIFTEYKNKLSDMDIEEFNVIVEQYLIENMAKYSLSKEIVRDVTKNENGDWVISQTYIDLFIRDQMNDLFEYIRANMKFFNN